MVGVVAVTCCPHVLVVLKAVAEESVRGKKEKRSLQHPQLFPNPPSPRLPPPNSPSPSLLINCVLLTLSRGSVLPLSAMALCAGEQLFTAVA